MNDKILKQARALQHTIRILQTRILTQKNAIKGTALLVAPKDFTIPQIGTILVVRDGGEMSLKDIAAATGVSPSSASSMVDRLVDHGVFVREHSNADRREIRISISPRGRDIVEFVERQLLYSLSEMLEKLGPKLARQWCEVYARIQDIIDDEARAKVARQDVAQQGVK